MRRRLTVAFLLVTIVPLSISLGVFWWLVDREFREDLVRQQEEARRGVATRLDALEADLRKVIDRLGEDPMIEYLCQDLKWERFYGDQKREREIVREASRLMRAPELDVLRVVDPQRDGHVIALGHRRGVESPDAAALATAREGQGAALWRRENLEQGSDTVARWTLQVARLFDGRVVLAGGTVLDTPFLQSLKAGLGHNVELAVFAPDGEGIVSTFPGGAVPADAEDTWDVGTVSRRLGGGRDGALNIAVYVSRAELHRALSALVQFAAVLGGIGLLLSMLLGAALSRNVVRPLRSLVEATEAIARGKFDHRIDVASRDEVGELVARFNRMSAEILEYQRRLVRAERIAAWKDIARQIAHEVKNPLFPIQTSVETLQKAWRKQHPRFGELCEETTRTVVEEVGRLSRIVSEFSRFARMPAPRLELADLAAAVHDSVVLFRDESAHVKIEEQLDASLAPFRFDTTLLGQVLNNLLKNAVEAVEGRDDGLVRATLTATGRRARVMVEDNGPGVPLERREQVFEPYVTHKDGGTGLGLAIAHRIVGEHGGELWVDESPLGGARFVFEIPLEQEAE